MATDQVELFYHASTVYTVICKATATVLFVYMFYAPDFHHNNLSLFILWNIKTGTSY